MFFVVYFFLGERDDLFGILQMFLNLFNILYAVIFIIYYLLIHKHRI